MSKEADRKLSKAESPATGEAAMSQKTDKKVRTDSYSSALPFPEMGDFHTGAFEAYFRASQAILESAATLNQEMVRFAGERFQADLEALQTLPGYTNVQGVVNFQSEFMHKTAEAYQAEFSKLMQQSTEATTTMFEPLIESAKNSTKETDRK